MTDQSLRDHVLYQLRGGGAHLGFEDAFAHLPDHLRGAKVDGIPHTCWQLLFHMRICQWDILEFSRNPKHASPTFPDGLWPASYVPPSDSAWDGEIEAFRSDALQMMDLVADPTTDLLAPIPHGEGQTILREAILVVDHNAYHLGQLVFLRRSLGAWKD